MEKKTLQLGLVGEIPTPPPWESENAKMIRFLFGSRFPGIIVWTAVISLGVIAMCI